MRYTIFVKNLNQKKLHSDWQRRKSEAIFSTKQVFIHVQTAATEANWITTVCAHQMGNIHKIYTSIEYSSFALPLPRIPISLSLKSPLSLWHVIFRHAVLHLFQTFLSLLPFSNSIFNETGRLLLGKKAGTNIYLWPSSAELSLHYPDFHLINVYEEYQ